MSVAYRTGKVGAGGGKPFVPLTKTWKAKTSTGFTYPTALANSMGCVMVIPVHEPNLPFVDVQTNRVVSKIGLMVCEDPLIHPTGHKEAYEDEYRIARVIKATYAITCWAKDAGTPAGDFIFAWKFADHTDSSDYTALTAATVADGGRRQWHDIRMSKAWQYKRFSSTQAGGSIWPCARKFNIVVPSVGKLTYGFEELDPTGGQVKKNPLFGALHQGNNEASTATEHPLYLHLLCFNLDRESMAENTWIADVDLYQTIMVTKDEAFGEMVDEMDVGT